MSPRTLHLGRLRHHVTALTLVAASLALAPGLAQPASAVAPASNAATITDVTGALSECVDGSTIVLTDDIPAPTTQLEVTCDLTLDLAGRDLSVRNIIVSGDKTFTVSDATDPTDPIGPGLLTADASSEYNTAGIQTDGATLVTTGSAHVTATGGYEAAGIGGRVERDGGVTTTNGASVITAYGGFAAAGIGGGFGGDGGTTTTNGSSIITAGTSGGPYAAGIGGGYGGEGGTTTIAGSSTVIAPGRYTAVGPGPEADYSGGPPYLDVTESGTLRVPSGYLRVPDTASGADIVVDPDAKITGSENAIISGDGQIQNDGTITLAKDNVAPPTVYEHHYSVTFDPNGGTSGTDPVQVTVYASSFTKGGRVFPANPTRAGFTFDRWATTATDTSNDPEARRGSSNLTGGSAVGETFDVESPLSGSSIDGTPLASTVYARWTATPPPPPPPPPPPGPSSLSVPAPQVSNTTSPERGTSTPRVGDVLAATTGATAPSGATISYQWTRIVGGTSTPILGATGASYELAAGDLGATIRVTATGTMTGFDPGHASSAPTGVVQAAPLSALSVDLTGDPVVGQTLTAHPHLGTETGGVTYTYQWHTGVPGGANAPIVDQTGPQLVLGEDLAGMDVYVHVTAAKPGNTTAAADSASLRVVSAPLGTFADPGLVILNTARVGRPLVATIHRPDIEGLELAYQWYTVTSTNGRTQVRTLAGDTGPEHTPVRSQIGKRMRLHLTLTAPGYEPLTVTGTTRPVRRGIIRRPEIVVTGTPRVDNTLTASIANPAALPEGSQLSYQWLIGGEPINDATGRDYRPTPDQAGHTLAVTITITAPGYNARTLTSRRLTIEQPHG